MPSMMMPKTVAWFERLAYATIALSAMAIPTNWAHIGPYYEKSPVGVIFSIMVPTLGLPILGVWLIARKRQNWARWLFLVYAALGVLGWARSGELGFPVTFRALTFVAQLLRCIAVALLFTPSAKPWFLTRSKKAQELQNYGEQFD
jgi:hypothetical protein